ncbi:unnamed protein product [Protopolystoma xenopodis]|uniref:Uncharacterized protein n=1 Tax=Protopolystoma xenopodis TaxID=117903 RepID=A0A3S5FFM9_9PLAT|nr:unnamed protein product [Protopolystoma xenopodis]
MKTKAPTSLVFNLSIASLLSLSLLLRPPTPPPIRPGLQPRYNYQYQEEEDYSHLLRLVFPPGRGHLTLVMLWQQFNFQSCYRDLPVRRTRRHSIHPLTRWPDRPGCNCSPDTIVSITARTCGSDPAHYCLLSLRAVPHQIVVVIVVVVVVVFPLTGLVDRVDRLSAWIPPSPGAMAKSFGGIMPKIKGFDDIARKREQGVEADGPQI